MVLGLRGLVQKMAKTYICHKLTDKAKLWTNIGNVVAQKLQLKWKLKGAFEKKGNSPLTASTVSRLYIRRTALYS